MSSIVKISKIAPSASIVYQFLVFFSYFFFLIFFLVHPCDSPYFFFFFFSRSMSPLSPISSSSVLLPFSFLLVRSHSFFFKLITNHHTYLWIQQIHEAYRKSRHHGVKDKISSEMKVAPPHLLLSVTWIIKRGL